MYAYKYNLNRALQVIYVIYVPMYTFYVDIYNI